MILCTAQCESFQPILGWPCIKIRIQGVGGITKDMTTFLFHPDCDKCHQTETIQRSLVADVMIFFL